MHLVTMYFLSILFRLLFLLWCLTYLNDRKLQIIFSFIFNVDHGQSQKNTRNQVWNIITNTYPGGGRLAQHPFPTLQATPTMCKEWTVDLSPKTSCLNNSWRWQLPKRSHTPTVQRCQAGPKNTGIDFETWESIADEKSIWRTLLGVRKAEETG